MSPLLIIDLFAGKLMPSLVATMRCSCYSPHQARQKAHGFRFSSRRITWRGFRRTAFWPLPTRLSLPNAGGVVFETTLLWIPQVLGIELASDSQASDRWALTSGGEYYGVGAGVGISGFRADLGLGDDFFGNREDAYSETVRKKRWDWYIDDFSARLKPNAKRILMNTRWHAEDVAGRVLDQIDRGIVRGRVISIPAIADGNNDALGRKPGEYLWDEPDGYNYGAFLRARQREASPMMWSALYQQRPAPEEGDYFKAAWLKSYVTAPALETLASMAHLIMR